MIKMQEYHFSSIDQVLYRYQFKNGFTLLLLAKSDFKEQAGLLTVNYGSLDATEDEAGFAHFLEHKLFESESGEDFLQYFTEAATDANAYTTFHHTAYSFSSTDGIVENTKKLLDMISSFSMTEESVEKEKGIILQELEMHQADPEQVLYTETLAHLYPDSPLAREIVGTKESITATDRTSLQKIYDRHYQAREMQLFLIGDFDPKELVNQLKDDINSLPNRSKKPHKRPLLQKQSVVTGQSKRMNVGKAKLAVGFRGNQSLQNEDLFVYKTKLELFFSLLLGWTSQRYQNLLDANKIDYSFQMEVEVQEAFHHVLFFVDTDEPVSLSHQLRMIVRRFNQSPDLSDEHLDVLKNELYGNFIQCLDHYDYIFDQYVNFQGKSLFDLPAILASIHLVDVIEVGKEFIETCDMMDFTILPNYT